MGSSTVSLIISPPTANSPAALAFAGQIYKANPTDGAFVVGSRTVTPGGAITVAGTRIPLRSGSSFALVGPSTISLIRYPSRTNFQDVLTFVGQTYTADSRNGAFVIGGQTVTPGGAITVAGTRIALVPTAAYAVGGTSTIPLQGNLQTLITFAGSTYTATPGSFMIGSQTLTPGGAITVSGTRISLSPVPATPYAVIRSSTLPLVPATVGPDFSTYGGQVYMANLPTDFVIAWQTLTPGRLITADGTPISLAPAATDAVVGMSTIGIRGYIKNGFNGRGESGARGNESVAQF